MSKNRKKENRKAKRSGESAPAAPVQKKESISLKWIVTAVGIVASVIGIIAFINDHIKQRALDIQLARAYQTEILQYYSQFVVGLHWTLPIGQASDAEVDSVFKYNRDVGKAIDLGAMRRDFLADIFRKYDFSKPMPNYVGDKSLNPTGFNHVLGNIERFGQQLEKHLDKYGGSASTELTSRLEYAQRMAKAEVGSIRLDLHTKGLLPTKTAEGIADFLLLLRGDLFWLQEEYGASVDPVLVGKVLKSHSTDGSIAVQWEYGKY